MFFRANIFITDYALYDYMELIHKNTCTCVNVEYVIGIDEKIWSSRLARIKHANSFRTMMGCIHVANIPFRRTLHAFHTQ